MDFEITDEMKRKITSFMTFCGVEFALDVDEFGIAKLIEAFCKTAKFTRDGDDIQVMFRIHDDGLPQAIAEMEKNPDNPPVEFMAQVVYKHLMERFFAESIMARTSVYMQNQINKRDISHAVANSDKMLELMVEARETIGNGDEDPDLVRGLFNMVKIMKNVPSAIQCINEHFVDREMEA